MSNPPNRFSRIKVKCFFATAAATSLPLSASASFCFLLHQEVQIHYSSLSCVVFSVPSAFEYSSLFCAGVPISFGQFTSVPGVLINSDRFSDPLTLSFFHYPTENAIMAFGNGSDFRTGAQGQAGGSITSQEGGPSASTEQQQQGPKATTGIAGISTGTEPNTLRAQIPAQVSERSQGPTEILLEQPSVTLQMFPFDAAHTSTPSL